MSTKVYISTLEHLWSEVAKSVNGALVFMDDSSAECLHWHGGLRKLLDSGAIAVENFSPFVKADSCIKKVVFIISSPIVDETFRTLMVIIRANSFKNCVVISSLPPKCHSDGISDAEQSFDALENQISNWMGNKNYNAFAYHIPLFAAHVSQELFIMPAFSKNFSVFSCGFLEMNRKRNADTSIKSLPLEMQTSIKHLASTLNSWLGVLQIKADIFSVGLLSHILGFELESLAQNQKKKIPPGKASVVIVDRLLDLAGPLSQCHETMLDKLLKALPHFSGHVFDVSIPMNDLSVCKNESVFGRPLLAPGCIAHKNSPTEISALNAILTKGSRDALIEVNRSVVECAAKEGISLDLTSRLTPDLLKKRILSFKEKPKLTLKYSGLLQQALAVVHALEYSSKNCIDELCATEKALIQYLTTCGEEALSNIIQMISDDAKTNFEMAEIMIFLAFIYMLSNSSKLANEPEIQATLMEAFFQDDDPNGLSSLFVDGELDEDSILNAVRTFFDVLRRIGTIRKGFKKYFSIFSSNNPAFPAEYNPLLKQLLDDIFDTSVADIPDVEFHSAGLKDYIKTGFSLFMNVAKPKPRDNPIILLIILGGITPSEIKLIRDMAAQKKGTEIIVCCTEVLTPSDILKDLGLIVKELSRENYGDGNSI